MKFLFLTDMCKICGQEMSWFKKRKPSQNCAVPSLPNFGLYFAVTSVKENAEKYMEILEDKLHR